MATTTYLNKSLVKIIFSEDSTLNILPEDMGSEMVSITLQSQPVEILDTACGILPSVMINSKAEVGVQVLRTSAVAPLFLNRVQTNGVIGGSLTVYDDATNVLTLNKVSVTMAEFPQLNGMDATVTLRFTGEFRVNKDVAII